ncbi:MAG: ATP-binding cassette domain-containing protein, partial [Planctomycetota bacterium]
TPVVWDSGCLEEVCGACTMVINGRVRQSCTCLLDEYAPSDGDVHLFGQHVSAPGRLMVPPADRAIGFLFQGAALWPHMTVAGTLDFVLKRRGSAKSRSERRARVAELLDAVDLAGFEKRRAPSLSGGEAQRLSLARALAAEPRILLLDEPLGPLDAPRREALLDLFARMTREHGLTTLHVTHDPDEAARVADRRVDLVAG